jgi:hypothetical protein
MMEEYEEETTCKILMWPRPEMEAMQMKDLMKPWRPRGR